MKQKTCAKGYSCGNACIAKTRKCRQETEPKVGTMTDKVVAVIKGESKKKIQSDAQPFHPKTKKESDALGVEGRKKLYDEIENWQPKGKPTAEEMELIKDNFGTLAGQTVSNRLSSFEADYVNGNIGNDEDSQREFDFYVAMKKYKNTAPVPKGPAYFRTDSILGMDAPGKSFNTVDHLVDLNTEPPAKSKGKYLVTIEDNKSGFKHPSKDGQLLSDRKYEVVSIKGNNVTIREVGKARHNRALIDGSKDGWSLDSNI